MISVVMTTKRLSPIVYRPAFGCSPCSSGFWLDILSISNQNSFEWLHLSHLSWLLLFVDTSSYLHLIEGEGERLDVHVIVTRNLFLFVHWVRAKYWKVLFASRCFGFWVFCWDILVAPSFVEWCYAKFWWTLYWVLSLCIVILPIYCTQFWVIWLTVQ